jgi:tetratricopeptide (TPR) repeat protein
VAEAWTLFRSFHEDLSRIDRARDLLEQIIQREPSLEALLLLAWVHLSWADLRTRNADEKLAGYERGRDVAKRAIELAPKSPEAHLWYAANLGRWAITKGKLRAAFLLSTLQEEIKTVLDLDPNHVAGLALAGSFYLETPGFLGGDLARAEAYEKKALALDPHFTRARVELAKVLIEQRRYPEARRELQQVVDEGQPTYVADWVIRHRPTAQRLLTQIQGGGSSETPPRF